MTTHSKKVGDMEVTALSDGVLATSLDVVLGMDRAEAGDSPAPRAATACTSRSTPSCSNCRDDGR
jgi:hypothetical protein